VYTVNPNLGQQALTLVGGAPVVPVLNNGVEVQNTFTFTGGDATGLRTISASVSGVRVRIVRQTTAQVAIGLTVPTGTVAQPMDVVMCFDDPDDPCDPYCITIPDPIDPALPPGITVSPNSAIAGELNTFTLSGDADYVSAINWATLVYSTDDGQRGALDVPSGHSGTVAFNVSASAKDCIENAMDVNYDYEADDGSYSNADQMVRVCFSAPPPPPTTVTLTPLVATLALTPQQQSPQQQFTASGTPAGGTYSWSKGAGLTLQNVSGAQATIQATSIGTSSVNVAYTAAGGGTATSTATVNVVAPKLVSVLWGGAGKQAMVKINTDWTQDPLDCPGWDSPTGVPSDQACPGYGTTAETTAIGTSSSPEWQTPNGDGSAVVTDPVAYVMGSTPMIQQAQITMSPNLSLTATVKVNICYFDDIGCAPYPGLAFSPATVNIQSGVGSVQLQSAGALPSYVVNDVVQLTWSISFDGGSTYAQFAQSTQKLFTIFASSVPVSSDTDYWVTSLAAPFPSQLLTVTAARLNYATGVLAANCQGSTSGCLSGDEAIVSAVIDSVYEFPGPSIETSYADPPLYGNYWKMLDGSAGVPADCISLAGLAGLMLAEIGIQADSHFAYTTGVQPAKLGDKDLTDAVNQTPDKTENGVDLKFVYLTTPNNCENDGEGFLRATVSAEGGPTEMAWTVWPPIVGMLPVSASAVAPTEVWIKTTSTGDNKSYNNRLFYQVLYTVLMNELVPSTLQGLQVWTVNIQPDPKDPDGTPPSLCGNPHLPPVEIVPLPVKIQN
jgi:hypothetical protein